MWDIFIAHASEDKDNLVRPLAQMLSKTYKVKVWYDEFSLEYGDSLLESIEKGLQKSKFGLVVLSKPFFEKIWTQHEYTSLKTKEMLSKNKVIIPIWYNIEVKDVTEYSLSLADKFAISIKKECNIDDLASKIIKVIRPDIYKNISRMNYFEKTLDMSKIVPMSTDKMSKPPIRHEELPRLIKARLRLIYRIIKEVDERNYEAYERDFSRNVNIDREIIITELITAAYLDCTKENMSQTEKRNIYILVLLISINGNLNIDLPMEASKQRECVKITEGYLKDIDTHISMDYKY